MSVEKKSVHVRLAPDMLDRLTVLAGLANNDVAEHAAFLLERTVVGEFHVVSMQADRMRRLGLTGTTRD